MLSSCAARSQDVSLALSAYRGQPVVVVSLRLNEAETNLTPMVVAGQADVNRTDDAASRMLYTVVGIKQGRMVVDVDWIELTTGHFYVGTATVPLGELERGPSGAVELMPVFAPGGVMVITSDPVPKSADDLRRKDVMRTCAKRYAQSDHDYRTTPNEIAVLSEALQSMGPSHSVPPCAR